MKSTELGFVSGILRLGIKYYYIVVQCSPVLNITLYSLLKKYIPPCLDETGWWILETLCKDIHDILKFSELIGSFSLFQERDRLPCRFLLRCHLLYLWFRSAFAFTSLATVASSEEKVTMSSNDLFRLVLSLVRISSSSETSGLQDLLTFQFN